MSCGLTSYFFYPSVASCKGLTCPLELWYEVVLNQSEAGWLMSRTIHLKMETFKAVFASSLCSLENGLISVRVKGYQTITILREFNFWLWLKLSQGLLSGSVSWRAWWAQRSFPAPVRCGDFCGSNCIELVALLVAAGLQDQVCCNAKLSSKS